MIEKKLGKIEHADIEIARGFLMGPIFQFSLSDSSGVGCGGKYTVNLSKSCKWDSEEQKAELHIKMNEYIFQLMKDAKVDEFSNLKGKPVEVEIEDRCFKNFRILKEVL